MSGYGFEERIVGNHRIFGHGGAAPPGGIAWHVVAVAQASLSSCHRWVAADVDDDPAVVERDDRGLPSTLAWKRRDRPTSEVTMKCEHESLPGCRELGHR
jgi:hypothetical protein